MRFWVAATMVPVVAARAGAQQVESGSALRERGPAAFAVAALPALGGVRLDGALDDLAWRGPAPIRGFTQSEPDDGRPASERTEVWVAYDAGTLYIAAHLFDSRPDAVVVSDLRKDFRTDTQDTFEVILDTFADRRNGYHFATNAMGARSDEQVTNEGRETNASWDGAWEVRTRRAPDGWTVEMAIPFRTLRASAVPGAGWGVNFARRIRRKNEVAYWAPVPRAYTIARLSLAGTLTALPPTTGGRDFRVTPYVLGKTVREVGGVTYEEQGDAGVDVKFGLTRGLTLDVTVNPDFAQAEADQQQVNLTQFSQFFPEKRDFFLENSGQFYIGDTPRNRRVAQAPRGDEDLLLFFSRRMGLAEDGRPVGIDGGIRLTGQEAGFQVGALALRTRALDSLVPGSDYGVVRLRHNLFRSSDVGGVVMLRSNRTDRGDYNRVYGADANLRLPGRVDWSSFAVNSETDGLAGPRYAFQTSFNREANFDHVKVGLLSIADNFNDELGFQRRAGVRVWSLDTGIRPRLAALRRLGIRELHPHVVWDYTTDQSGGTVAKRLHNGFTAFLNDGGFAELSANPRSERLDAPFQLDARVDSVAAGRYDWTEWRLFMGTDPSRAVSLDFTGILGGLWSGTQRTVNAGVTVRPSYRFSTSVSLQRTDATLAGQQRFVRAIWAVRTSYSFSTIMYVDALLQYDASTDQLNSNVRFNFIHHPLSNLYVVFNEQRSTLDGAPAPGRSVIIKLTRMVGL